MLVKIVNGCRKGKAIIFNDGVPFIILYYDKGLLNGTVDRMNEYGMVALHGHLTNGIESGLFEEYDKNGEVVWRGYYRNGKRYKDVRGRIVKKGNDNEKSNETEWYYELDEKGVMKNYSLYEKGVLCRVLMEFDGNIMTEFDKKGRRVYEGEYKGDMKNGFVRDGKGREYGEGEYALYTGEWKNGKRNGLGTEYSGFNPLYSGEWKEGKRHGRGQEMDKNGKVVRSGSWLNGVFERKIKTVVSPSSLTSNPILIEEMKIGDDSFNLLSITVLKLLNLPLLKRITIGDDCFKEVRNVEFCKLSVLEELVIGKRSFTCTTDIHVDKHYSVKKKGYFHIAKCSKLKSIQIGDYSLSDYTSFSLKTLPSLQSIEIGSSCFYFVASFSLACSNYQMA